MSRNLATIAELCSVLKVSRSTVNRWRVTPSFPKAYRANRGVWWDLGEVLEWFGRQPSVTRTESLKTTEDICKMLNISRKTFWEQRKSDPMFPKPGSMGRAVRWSADELLAYCGAARLCGKGELDLQFKTIDELQLVLNISRSTFWRLRRSDPEFPNAVVFGSVSRWELGEVRGYMAKFSNRVGAAGGTEIDTLQTANQICSFVGISRSTLYRWRLKDSSFPQARYVGNSMRWELSEIIAYTAKKQRCPADEFLDFAKGLALQVDSARAVFEWVKASWDSNRDAGIVIEMISGNPALATEYLRLAYQGLEEERGDWIFHTALMHLVSASGGTGGVARKVGLTDEGLSEALSLDGGPALRTIRLVLHAAGLTFDSICCRTK